MLRKYSYSWWIFPQSLLSHYDLTEYAVEGSFLPSELAQSCQVFQVTIDAAKLDVARTKIQKLTLQISRTTGKHYCFQFVNGPGVKRLHRCASLDDDLPFS